MLKRKADDVKTTLNLEQALKIVEKLKKPISLKKATSVLEKLGSVRPAKVVLASKISKKVLDYESYQDEEAAALSETQRKILEELNELDYRKCCRGPAMGKQLSSSRILAVCRPVMERVPNPRRLSDISKVLEIMLTYTQVGLDSSLTEWDEFEEWVEAKLSKIPLFAQITE